MSQDYGPSIEIDPIYKFLHQGKVEQRECLAVVCWVWDSGVGEINSRVSLTCEYVSVVRIRSSP